VVPPTGVTLTVGAWQKSVEEGGKGGEVSKTARQLDTCWMDRLFLCLW
jgi:hypothetical protein